MAQPRKKRKPFHVSVLEKIARTSPTNEAMIAADLRVTVSSVERVVNALIRQGDVERVEVPGYIPHLAITRQGREYLREQEPGWWRTARDPQSLARLQSELMYARQNYNFWARQEHRLTRDEYAQKMEADRRVRELEGAIARKRSRLSRKNP